MKCILILFVVSAWAEAAVIKIKSGDQNRDIGERQTEQSEKAKSGELGQNQDSAGTDGGIAAPRRRTLRNIRPCDLHDCMWPKASDGKVYIPYVIADHYSPQELDVIREGINSFSVSTCIRFIPRTNQKDYLHIQSLDGCYSYVGRQGSVQTVSLSRQGCILFGTVQHELLHVLGFNHEHRRSDRDQHIQVLLQNVIKGEEFNFGKTDTLNQRTPYDYGSVMHYDRLAYSRDKHSPTMVALPDPDASFGAAAQMSQGDVDRVKLLYCRK